MKILVVDDEPTILKSTVAKIEKVVEGAEITSFTNARKSIEWIKENDADVAILDIKMPDIDGIKLALFLKKNNPDVNIIFSTAYSDYAIDAMKMRASGYMLKPIKESMIREEFENLRHATNREIDDIETDLRVKIKTFGNFEVYVDNEIMNFSRGRSKEILALLVDANGDTVSSKKMAEVIWGIYYYDINASKNVSISIRELYKDLKKMGIDYIVKKAGRSYYIDKEKVKCDIFDVHAGDVTAINRFEGKYMDQYPWAKVKVINFFKER